MDDPHSRLDALGSRDIRLLRRILSGRSDANIRFAELRRLLRNMGFSERVTGSHYIFSVEGIPENINLQPRRDGMAKTYQVRQARKILAKYGVTADGA